jgi:hypothetical protein
MVIVCVVFEVRTECLYYFGELRLQRDKVGVKWCLNIITSEVAYSRVRWWFFVIALNLQVPQNIISSSCTYQSAKQRLYRRVSVNFKSHRPPPMSVWKLVYFISIFFKIYMNIHSVVSQYIHFVVRFIRSSPYRYVVPFLCKIHSLYTVDKQRKCKNVHHWSKHIFQMRSYRTSLSLVCIFCGHKSVIAKENHTFILQSWKIVCPIFVNARHIQKCLLWNFYILI